MKKLFTLLILIVALSLNAQNKKVFFIGNGYTGVNNLPKIVYNDNGLFHTKRIIIY